MRDAEDNDSQWPKKGTVGGSIRAVVPNGIASDKSPGIFPVPGRNLRGPGNTQPNGWSGNRSGE